MKLLFTDTDRGYSWSHTNRYYLCETDEEYNELLTKCKNHENYHDVECCGRVYQADNYEQMFEKDIYCNPHTEVSDGFATHGGHKLKAHGIDVRHKSGTNSMDYTSHDYYIKPGSIEQDESVKTENWWV